MNQLVQNLAFVGIIAVIVAVALKLVFQDYFRPDPGKGHDKSINVSRNDVEMGTLATKWSQQVDESTSKLVITAFTKTAILKKTVTFSNGHPFRIGRAVDNDLQIKDPTVSRHHLMIYKDDKGWYFCAEENTETRDTKLKLIENGQDVSIADNEGKLMTEEVYVGEIRLQFSMHTTRSKADEDSYAFRSRHNNKENPTIEYRI